MGKKKNKQQDKEKKNDPSAIPKWRTWSTEKQWMSGAAISQKGLVATASSFMKDNEMWVGGAQPIPVDGQHYFEVTFIGCSTSTKYQAIGIWAGDPVSSTNGYRVTKNMNPFYGLRGDGDNDSLRLWGQGAGAIENNQNGVAISNDERIGVLVDTTKRHLTFFRDGIPIKGASLDIQAAFLNDKVRIMASCRSGSISLSAKTLGHASPPIGVFENPIAESAKELVPVAEPVDDVVHVTGSNELDDKRVRPQSVEVSGHPDKEYNGKYLPFAHWNGRPAYRLEKTTGVLRKKDTSTYLYWYNSSTEFGWSWCLDNRDQSLQDPPGVQYWHSGGFSSTGGNRLGAPAAGTYEWHPGNQLTIGRNGEPAPDCAPVDQPDFNYDEGWGEPDDLNWYEDEDMWATMGFILCLVVVGMFEPAVLLLALGCCCLCIFRVMREEGCCEIPKGHKKKKRWAIECCIGCCVGVIFLIYLDIQSKRASYCASYEWDEQGICIEYEDDTYYTDLSTPADCSRGQYEIGRAHV